jgi:hypothetical protein
MRCGSKAAKSRITKLMVQQAVTGLFTASAAGHRVAK